MGHGARSVFTGSIASGASTSGDIDLARGWSKVYAEIGTMSTAAAIAIHAKGPSDGSYYTVFHPSINSATVGTPQFFIASGVGTNGGVTEIPCGYQYIRFVASAVVSGGVTIKVICSD